MVGLGILVFMVVFCFVGPLVYRTNQVTTNLSDVALAPARRTHWAPTSRGTTSWAA